MFAFQRQRTADRWFGAVAGFLAALVVVGVIAIVVRHDQAKKIPIGDYVKLLSDSVGVGLPAGLAPSWPSTLGSAALPADARVVRIGARIADLEIAAHARNAAAAAAYYGHDLGAIAVVRANSALVAGYATDLVNNLDHTPLGPRSADFYLWIENEGERGATVDLLDLARQQTIGYRLPYLALGNWLEAARVAALRGDRRFLTGTDCRAEAATAASLPGLSPMGRTALERVRALMPTDSTGDLDALESALTEALWVMADGRGGRGDAFRPVRASERTTAAT